jgi:hypothetical protein
METIDIEGYAISLFLAEGKKTIAFSEISAFQIKSLSLLLGCSSTHIEGILALRSCNYKDVLYIPICIHGVISCESGYFTIRATCGESSTVVIQGTYFGAQSLARRRKTWATKTTFFQKIECSSSSAAD